MQVEPFKTTLALRMAYVPEAVQNYVPAVLQVPPLPFGAATFIGSFLYALLWARLGAQLGSAAAIASAPEKLTPEKIVFFAWRSVWTSLPRRASRCSAPTSSSTRAEA